MRTAGLVKAESFMHHAVLEVATATELRGKQQTPKPFILANE